MKLLKIACSIRNPHLAALQEQATEEGTKDETHTVRHSVPVTKGVTVLNPPLLSSPGICVASRAHLSQDFWRHPAGSTHE
jgi:hypothetical protein